jgi:hypothetical protein
MANPSARPPLTEAAATRNERRSNSPPDVMDFPLIWWRNKANSGGAYGADKIALKQ